MANVAGSDWSADRERAVGLIENGDYCDVMFALQKARLDADGRKRFVPTGEEFFYPGATFPWRKPPPRT